MVEVCGFVEDLGCVGEHKEAVGEAFRDPELMEIAGLGAGGEMEAGPLAEGGGDAAQVEGDVPDVAGEDANELALGFFKLIVETAEDALAGERLVVLDEGGGEAGGSEGRCIEELGEPATLISEAARLKQLDIGERRIEDCHSSQSSFRRRCQLG